MMHVKTNVFFEGHFTSEKLLANNSCRHGDVHIWII